MTRLSTLINLGAGRDDLLDLQRDGVFCPPTQRFRPVADKAWQRISADTKERELGTAKDRLSVIGRDEVLLY